MDEEMGYLESMSHKGQKVRSYALDFKLNAVEFAENNGINTPATKFGADRRRIRECKSMKNSLSEVKGKPTAGVKRKRVDGAGRKPLYERMEDIVQEWIHERR